MIMAIAHLAVYVLLGVTAISAKPPSAIRGGTIADVDEFPYQVALTAWEQHTCGGTIIGPRHVLTAAHCVDSRGIDPVRDMLVLAGTNKLDWKSGNYYRIKSFKKHPRYAPFQKWQNDIAILTLATEIKFNSHESAAKLPEENTPENVTCKASGWGDLTFPNGAAPENLKKLSMKTISNEKCRWSLRDRVHDSQLCAIDRHGTGLCTGDSGGPLLSKDTIIGIASYVYPCGVGYPDIFTRVYTFVDWIKEVMNES